MIAGVDVSTRNIALVVISSKTGEIVRLDEFPIPELKYLGHNKAERCRAIAKTGFVSALKGVTVLYVEQPMGRQIKGVAEVERVVGAVLASVPSRIPISLISPPEWKKIVGLRGNAKKEDIRQWAEGLYPLLDGTSQDIVDASMIARACYVEVNSNNGE